MTEQTFPDRVSFRLQVKFETFVAGTRICRARRSQTIIALIMQPMRTLYDPIEPYDSGHISVSEVHQLYYEQCGNPHGKPVVFLHGGPGEIGRASCRERV